MGFQRTTAINKILSMSGSKRIVQGSTSAGKTHGIIPVLIDRATREKLKITVVAETIPALKDGAVDIFKNVMQETNRWIDEHWKQNPMEYTFGNGSVIQFKSFDSVGKAKASGKRDILFINEANHIPYPIADALIIRSNEVYVDFNPDNEFWVHEELMSEPGAEFLKLTYLDNEAIPEPLLLNLLSKREKAFFNPLLPYDQLFDAKNIKSEHWSNWWRVYGLGEVGRLEGVIFDNWEKIEQVPPNAQLISYVLDFGYSNDPSALISIWKWNGKYVLNEEIYEAGLTNPQIVKKFKDLGLNKAVQIICDSAEQKSIKELQMLGLKARPATKGADSVNFGIQRMLDCGFLITRKSVNLLDEFRRYKWATDKLGKPLNTPVDLFNHGIDAVRYFFTTLKPKAKAPKSRAYV